MDASIVKLLDTEISFGFPEKPLYIKASLMIPNPHCRKDNMIIMINEIKKMYHTLCEAIIVEIEYLNNQKAIPSFNVNITCRNLKTEHWEEVLFRVLMLKIFRF
jgi:hypothetical protein